MRIKWGQVNGRTWDASKQEVHASKCDRASKDLLAEQKTVSCEIAFGHFQVKVLLTGHILFLVHILLRSAKNAFPVADYARMILSLDEDWNDAPHVYTHTLILVSPFLKSSSLVFYFGWCFSDPTRTTKARRSRSFIQSFNTFDYVKRLKMVP